jgi:LysM repeat protein
MPYSADALDSRDDDWQIDGFDGQTHFSDDGQLYQPIDPNVSTGNSDALWVPPPGARTSGTLHGDMPSHFDYLRNPGYAEEFHPRVFPAPKVRDLGPVLAFENPYEPFPKGNSPRVKSLRQRLDETIMFSDDAQGLPEALYGDYGDAGAVGSDRLNPGESLRIGQAISSGPFRAVLQADGNFVVYKGGEVLYATGVHPGVNQVAMQTDGNLVLYAGRAPAWDSGTAGRRGAFLVMQGDGNLVLYHGRTPLWSSGTQGGRKAPSGKSFLGSIGSAIGSVGSAVGSVVQGVARPVGGLLTSPMHLVSDIAHGKNLLSSIKDTVKRDLGNVGAVAPYAQAVLSIVPGVGQGVNAAIAAGSAIAHGQPITDALVNGVKAMVPGGPLAQQALDTAYRIAKGGNVIAAAADAARAQLPGGELAKRAFDTGLALAHGANLQKTLVSQGTDIAKGQAMSLLSDAVSQLSPINNRVLSGQGPQFIGDTVRRAAMGLVPPSVRNVGQALLQNPALRSLPIADLARRMNVPIETARQAAASLLSSVQRAGGPSIANMSPATDLARRLNPGHNFDQLLSMFGSQMAPIAYSPNAMARRARPLAMQWARTARGFIPNISEASGLDSTGTVYIVESGDSMSKIAAKLTGSSSRVGELIKANPQVADPNKIFVGQRLKLPLSWQTKAAVPTQAPPLTTSASPNASPSPLPTFSAPVVTTAVAQSMPTISQQAKSSGAAVISWQNILIRDGFAPQGTADGFFGPNTTTRTKAWQAKHGLGADGVVGKNTWAAALSTLPAVIAPSALPSAAIPPVIQTPLGPVSLPPGLLPPGLIPVATTISESPVAQPIPTALPPLLPMPTAAPAPAPMALPPAPGVLPPGTTIAPDGSLVVARPTGPSEVTVHEEPISGAPPKAASAGAGIGAIALALGALYFVGKGKLGL